MKRIINLNIMFIMMVCLCFLASCRSKKVNYFVSGNYSGKSETGLVYYLEVNKIDLETFEKEWPINVVHDMSYKKNTYYRLCLYYYENEIKTFINFYELKDISAQSRDVPLEYADSNNYQISPVATKTGYSDGAYEITVNDVYVILRRIN